SKSTPLETSSSPIIPGPIAPGSPSPPPTRRDDPVKLPMPFGNPKTYTNHSGVDFPQSGGTPIYASGNGTVARHSKSPSGGHWIVINYDGIGEVGYAHMNDW